MARKNRNAETEAKTKTSPPTSASQDLGDLTRRKLVRRSHFTVIIAAWLITVPAAALMSAAMYWLLSQFTM